jgi:DNA polymerase-3 subunit gamma/tau
VAEAPAIQIRSLGDIAALADTHRDMAFKVLLKRCVRPVKIESGRIDISLTAEAPKTLITDLNANLQKWTGRRWIVSVSREEGGQTLAEQEASRRETAFTDARNDPTVAAIMARFPGAKVIDVRIPDAPEAVEEDQQVPVEPPADDDEI